MKRRTRRARSLAAIAAVVASASITAAAQGPDTAGEKRKSWPPRLRDDRPQLVVGADFGFAHYGRTEADGDFGFGPSWQARIGAQVLPWLGFDARYFGARHDGIGALVAHGGSLDARFSLPFRLVRPYLSAGFGFYSVTAYDEDGVARVNPDPATQLPASLGVEVLLHEHIGVQAEGTYRFLFDENVPGASFARTQLWGGTLGARAYF